MTAHPMDKLIPTRDQIDALRVVCEAGPGGVHAGRVAGELNWTTYVYGIETPSQRAALNRLLKLRKLGLAEDVLGRWYPTEAGRRLIENERNG